MKIILGDMKVTLQLFPENYFDSIVTDPPYHLDSIVKRFGSKSAAPAKHGTDGAFKRASSGFMGQTWDNDIMCDVEAWKAAYRVLKPGGHMLAFSHARTYHRMVTAIEAAGFEIRDQIMWLYGSGFPKASDISKQIDKQAGNKREKIPTGLPVKRMIPGATQDKTGSWVKEDGREYQPGIEIPASPDAAKWQGWKTALKPAHEPICVARKPISEKTVASNVLKHGTGALNIDGCRVSLDGDYKSKANGRPSMTGLPDLYNKDKSNIGDTKGRFPANVITDGSKEIINMFPITKGAGAVKGTEQSKLTNTCYGEYKERFASSSLPGGSAARFFYSAKANKTDRAGSKHPTVKPQALMRYLCRLITPPGGIILDPFAGSGSTLEAAFNEGFVSVGVELTPKYYQDIKNRIGNLNAN